MGRTEFIILKMIMIVLPTILLFAHLTFGLPSDKQDKFFRVACDADTESSGQRIGAADEPRQDLRSQSNPLILLRLLDGANTESTRTGNLKLQSLLNDRFKRSPADTDILGLPNDNLDSRIFYALKNSIRSDQFIHKLTQNKRITSKQKEVEVEHGERFAKQEKSEKKTLVSPDRFERKDTLVHLLKLDLESKDNGWRSVTDQSLNLDSFPKQLNADVDLLKLNEIKGISRDLSQSREITKHSQRNPIFAEQPSKLDTLNKNLNVDVDLLKSNKMGGKFGEYINKQNDDQRLQNHEVITKKEGKADGNLVKSSEMTKHKQGKSVVDERKSEMDLFQKGVDVDVDILKSNEKEEKDQRLSDFNSKNYNGHRNVKHYNKYQNEEIGNLLQSSETAKQNQRKLVAAERGSEMEPIDKDLDVEACRHHKSAYNDVLEKVQNIHNKKYYTENQLRPMAYREFNKQKNVDYNQMNYNTDNRRQSGVMNSKSSITDNQTGSQESEGLQTLPQIQNSGQSPNSATSACKKDSNGRSGYEQIQETLEKDGNLLSIGNLLPPVGLLLGLQTGSRQSKYPLNVDQLFSRIPLGIPHFFGTRTVLRLQNLPDSKYFNELSGDGEVSETLNREDNLLSTGNLLPSVGLLLDLKTGSKDLISSEAVKQIGSENPTKTLISVGEQSSRRLQRQVASNSLTNRILKKSINEPSEGSNNFLSVRNPLSSTEFSTDLQTGSKQLEEAPIVNDRNTKAGVSQRSDEDNLLSIGNILPPLDVHLGMRTTSKSSHQLK